MPETFTPYRTADYIKSPVDAAAYLTETAREGSASELAAAIGRVMQGQDRTALASRMGMSREGAYKAFSSKGNPSLATAMAAARALGLRIVFVPAESEG